MSSERREGLVELLGIEEESISPGKVRCTLRVEERHQNIQGVIHGSVPIALMDTAMGHALDGMLADDEFCSTTQFSVQFRKAARPGALLEAVGEVVRKGRRIAYIEGICRDEAGDVVTTAHGTWYVGTVT